DHLRALSEPFAGPHGRMLGWTYGDLDEVNERNQLRASSVLSGNGEQHPRTQVDKCLQLGMGVCPSASMLSRHAFNAIGGFDEQTDGFADDDLFLRLFLAGYRSIYIPRSLTRFRIRTSTPPGLFNALYC
ncbi:MAG TPA: hypothetical protein VGC87_23425, partial [Pyrinomonadaceae bacterium]